MVVLQGRHAQQFHHCRCPSCYPMYSAGRQPMPGQQRPGQRPAACAVGLEQWLERKLEQQLEQWPGQRPAT
eukprot:1161955-Pelagomonas_calceolata.AAC.17